MEIASIDQLNLTATYSYRDYLEWKFEERVELIKGRVVKMSNTTTMHQLCVGEIFRQISNHLYQSNCGVILAPFDVRLTKEQGNAPERIYTVVQPDISVICDTAKIDELGCLGSPDLVIEILTAGDDPLVINEKLEIYQEVAVKECWVVNPDNHIILFYLFDQSGLFHDPIELTEHDTLQSSILGTFKLAVKGVFNFKI